MIASNNGSNLLQSLSPSLREGLDALARAEGTSADQLLILAIAEKLARTEHAAWLAQRAGTQGTPTARETIRERLRDREAKPAAGSRTNGDARVSHQRTSLADDADSQLSRKDDERESRKLADLCEDAPVFLAVLSGPDHVFETVNDAYRKLLGNRELIGRRVVDCIPEVAGTAWMDLLDHVYKTGEPRFDRGVRLSLAPSEGAPLEDMYVDYTYEPRREADGRVSGIFALGVETSLVQEVLQSAGAGRFLLGDK